MASFKLATDLPEWKNWKKLTNPSVRNSVSEMHSPKTQKDLKSSPGSTKLR